MKEIEAVLRMASQVADPVHDLCIAGEGNVSICTEDGRLWVSASGSRLGDLGVDDLVEIRPEVILAGLETCSNDEEWLEVLLASRVDPTASRPSVEVGLHAVLAGRTGAGVILHTHPTAVLGVMAAGRGEELASTRLLPDQIVLCGPRSQLLPYLDPGLTLAREIRDILIDQPCHPVWLLSNHGIVCWAPHAQTALDMTLMTTKCARVILASPDRPAVGMPEDQVRRIAGREDEHFRRERLGFG